ncbi:MAG: hypothetical protein AAGA40_18365 [Cyanobacteria bacterium P01_E01_bin.45]
MATAISAFLAAVQNGCRNDWLTKTFGDTYPQMLPDAEIIADLMSARFFNNSLSMSECEQCGRLWIQKELDSPHRRSFSPDDNSGYGRHFAYTKPDKSTDH